MGGGQCIAGALYPATAAIVAFENRPDYAQLAVDLGMPVGSIGPTRGRCLAKLRALVETGESR